MKVNYRGFDIEATRENKEEINYFVFFEDYEVDSGINDRLHSVKDVINDCKILVDEVYENPEMYDLEEVL